MMVRVIVELAMATMRFQDLLVSLVDVIRNPPRGHWINLRWLDAEIDKNPEVPLDWVFLAWLPVRD